MTELPLRFPRPVTLVGAGALSPAMLAEARAIAPDLVAADSAALTLRKLRLRPLAVIGDMDSLSDPHAHSDEGTRVLHLAEQETTDFEKCLYATDAPFYVAAGFTGGRLDHTLATLHALLRYPEKRVVVLSEADALALAEPGRTLRLRLAPGARVSIFPLLAVRGRRSQGLVWPTDGLDFAPGRRIGTSNEASHPVVELEFDEPGALVIVERAHLGALVHAVAGPPGTRR